MKCRACDGNQAITVTNCIHCGFQYNQKWSHAPNDELDFVKWYNEEFRDLFESKFQDITKHKTQDLNMNTVTYYCVGKNDDAIYVDVNVNAITSHDLEPDTEEEDSVLWVDMSIDIKNFNSPYSSNTLTLQLDLSDLFRVNIEDLVKLTKRTVFKISDWSESDICDYQEELTEQLDKGTLL